MKATLYATVLSAALIVAVGCGQNSDGTGPETEASPDAIDLSGVAAELIINRQRDLLDRGLINVLIHNNSENDLFITDRHLQSTFFDTDPAPPRNSQILAGRQVAVQVPYGSASDCTSPGEVAATLAITVTFDKGSPGTPATLDLSGTDILDGLRAKQCTTKVFNDATDLQFTDTAIEDETVTTRLVITRTAGEETFELGAVSGTILVGTNRLNDPATNTLGPNETSLEIPLIFVVNRCDPHAMAEVTKKFGTDFEISIDGAPFHAVAIDVEVLTPELQAIVQRCRERTADD